MRSVRPASPRWCCSPPTPPTCASSSPSLDGRFQPREPVRHRRPAARRAAALPVRLDGHDRGRPRGGRRGQGRARPVRATTRASWPAPRKPELRPHGRPRHQGGDQGDDHPLAAAGARADRGLLRDHRGRRPGQRLRRARRAAARRDRRRPVRRDLDDLGRRRVGQRQEVHRGRQPRRQGLAKPTRPR